MVPETILTESGAPFTAVILAAERPGAVNPIAVRAGVSHKCLVPIAGKPLISHVIAAFAHYPGLAGVRISIERTVHHAIDDLLSPWREAGMTIACVASRDNIADSVLAALAEQQALFVITTADNVLLSRAAIGETLAALRAADVVANLATQASVQAVHPRAQRKFYPFRDGGYANCNLYGVSGPRAFAAAEMFREGGQFMRNPARMLRTFGLVIIVAMRFKLVSLAGAMRLVSRRFGLRFHAVVPADGAQAVDVDNERTYAIAEEVLRQRNA